MKRFAGVAAVVVLGALAACDDLNNPIGAEGNPSYNAQEEGPGGTIGSGHEQMTASTDTTGRGPGGTIGSGH
jgi:hypothetical protein